jgi:hypothetical protein
LPLSSCLAMANEGDWLVVPCIAPVGEAVVKRHSLVLPRMIWILTLSGASRVSRFGKHALVLKAPLRIGVTGVLIRIEQLFCTIATYLFSVAVLCEHFHPNTPSSRAAQPKTSVMATSELKTNDSLSEIIMSTGTKRPESSSLLRISIILIGSPGSKLHFGAAGGAVEYPVRQRTHLWMPTLASVFSEGVREDGYLLKCPKEGSVDGVAAEVALV